MNYVVKIFPLLAMLFVLSCTSTAQSGGSTGTSAKDVSTAEFEQLIKDLPNAQLVDVRTPPEVAQGRIKGADNVNFNDANFVQNMGKYDKNKPLLLYCRSGNRSGRAMSALKAAGFTDIYNMSGGMLAWQKEGREVAR